MASFNKYQCFVEHLAEGVHTLNTAGNGGDTLKVALTNDPPDAAADTVRADISELSTANGYTSGGITVTINTSGQSGGTYSLTVSNDPQWTGSGGGFGPFRYVVLYNDTPTSPADPLIGWWDYGSSVSCLASETFTVDLAATIITIV